MADELEEILIELFDVDREKAKQISERQTLHDFDNGLTRLESLLGESVAYEIIRLGDFAFYRNSRLQDYFNLAEQVLDRIKDRVHQDNGNWHARLFYSVESLNKFLERGEEETQEKEPAEVGFSRYYLFNKNNEISRPYLGSLISNGELFVGTHEHWLGSNRPGGPRGRNILIKIGYELKVAFSEAGFDNPKVRINYGQHSISVDDETQKRLRILRDMAYNP
ncbi:hypothetical protein J4443_04175 [Candidatus Woesearchaeota archaeon]|nr:hypothetical protein [Candidatus Woesearchaeota archaeon]